MNKMIKMLMIVLMAATTTTAFAHHHHHHRGTGFAIGAGILGAGLLASTIYDATHPRPYVARLSCSSRLRSWCSSRLRSWCSSSLSATTRRACRTCGWRGNT